MSVVIVFVLDPVNSLKIRRSSDAESSTVTTSYRTDDSASLGENETHMQAPKTTDSAGGRISDSHDDNCTAFNPLCVDSLNTQVVSNREQERKIGLGVSNDIGIRE